MYTLARNAATDHFRKASRRREDPCADAEPASPAPAPAARLEQEQAARDLRRALMRLAPDKREVLILSRFGTMKFEEIARLLDCPVGTVKVRAHRAIKELREIYLGQLSEARP
jgi:RNA polymerase sigma-70 factor (ECF subfamily)